MTVFNVRSMRLSLLAGVVLLAVRCGLAQEHPETEQPPAAAAAGQPAESASDHGGHGAVDYNQPPLPPHVPGLGTLFIFSLVLFGLFLLIGRAIIWNPLIRALDEREERILGAQAEAEKAKTEAARLLAAHDAKMNEVQEQVKGIVAQARQQADAEKAQIIASAEAEAKALRDRALAEIRRAQEEAMSGLLATVDRQVGLATEQVLGHRLN